MANVPDYSQYIRAKKTSVSQKGYANQDIRKDRVASRFDGYFPMYRGISLPANALLSNKFITPPPFGPASITGLSLWLDASDPLANGSVLPNNTSLTTWYDKSYSGKHAIAQGAPGVSVTTIVSSPPVPVNGLTTLSFGNNSYKVTYPAFPNGEYTIFMNSCSLSNSTSYRTALSAPYAGAGFGIFLGVGASGQNVAMFTGNSVNAWNDQTENPNSIIDLKIFRTKVMTVKNGILSAYIDGTSAQPDKTGTTGPIADLEIGQGIAPWVGNLGDIVIYNKSLTVSERQQMEGYLAWKWGTQSQLPVSHPYKSIKP